MGLTLFVVELDSPTDAYYCGSVMNGLIKFTINSPKTIRGLRIEIEGKAKTYWRKTRTYYRNGRSHSRREYFRGSEQYIYNVSYLLGGRNAKMELQAGHYEYAFTTTLPLDGATSFEGKYGHVRYKVTAVLDRPWKYDNEVEKEFTVIQPVDLNHNPSAKVPVYRQDDKMFCCLCCQSGPLTLTLSLPHAGYVPQQAIPFYVHVDNASRVQVKSVEVELYRSTTYIATYPRHSRKWSTKTINSWILPGVGPHQNRSYYEQLVVPPKQHPDITNCSVITARYYLQVVARASGGHKNLSCEAPIYIGTVAVQPPPAAPPAHPAIAAAPGWSTSGIQAPHHL